MEAELKELASLIRTTESDIAEIKESEVTIEDIDRYVVPVSQEEYPYIFNNCTLPFLPSLTDLVEQIQAEREAEETGEPSLKRPRKSAAKETPEKAKRRGRSSSPSTPTEGSGSDELSIRRSNRKRTKKVY